jgi:uncharacterized protein (TIGR03083 family)
VSGACGANHRHLSAVRADFLAAARVAADLLRTEAVAAAWTQPSALPKFSVGGLAGHLAFQVLAIPRIIVAPLPSEPVIPLLEHYQRVSWVGAGADEEINVAIRDGGEAEAAGGPAALVDGVDSAIEELSETLAKEDNRPVRIAFWGPWSLTLDDMLIARTMELVVHSDDLAASVGIATPEFPSGPFNAVIDLLSRLSVARNGQTAVLRALSRAERAPDTIVAI